MTMCSVSFLDYNIAADALDACVTRSSTAMVLTISDNQVCVFHG